MGAGAAQIEPRDRGSVLRPPGERPQPEHLTRRHVEVGDFVNRQLESRRDLRETNARLRAQVLLYQARLQKLDALEVENIRLRQLLDSSYEVGESVVIAEQLRVPTGTVKTWMFRARGKLKRRLGGAAEESA